MDDTGAGPGAGWTALDGDAPGSGGPAEGNAAKPTAADRSALRPIEWAMSVLCFGFICIFSALSPTQNLATTSLTGKVGYWTLASGYCGMMCTALLAPELVARVGCKISLLLGGVCYVVFQGAVVLQLHLIHQPWWSHRMYLVSVPGGFVMGIGGAVVWTAQGIYTSMAAKAYADRRSVPPAAYLGLFNGVFFALIQASDFLSNLAAGGLTGVVTDMALFSGFWADALFGAAAFFVLPSEARFHERPVGSGLPRLKRVSSGSWFIGPRMSSVDKAKMVLLIPAFVMNGFGQGYVYGEFTHNGAYHYMGQSSIGYVMSAFAVTSMIMSVLLGLVADRWGNGIVASCGGVSFLVPVTILVLEEVCESGASGGSLGRSFCAYIPVVPAMAVSAVLLGVSDAAWNVVVTSLLGTFPQEHLGVCFGLFKFFQAAATAAAIMMSCELSLADNSIAAAAIVALTFACLAAMHSFLFDINRKCPRKNRNVADMDVLGSGNRDPLLLGTSRSCSSDGDVVVIVGPASDR